MAGFENDVLVATNVNFNPTAPKPHPGIVTADGQLLIGASVAPFIRAGTLTAGSGISITNGAGSITISSPGTISTWNQRSSGTNPNAISVFNGYIAVGGSLVTFTLPTTAAVGDVFMVTGYGTDFKIEQAAGQSVLFGSQTTTTGVAGYLQSTNSGDHLTILCIAANTTFKVIGSIGNITVA